MKQIADVKIIGRVSSEILRRFTPNGIPKTEMRVAVNRNIKGKDGNWIEEASFFPVVAWKEVGEKAFKELKKGSLVIIEGILKNRQWEKDGVKRIITEVTAFNISPVTEQIAVVKQTTDEIEEDIILPF